MYLCEKNQKQGILFIDVFFRYMSGVSATGARPLYCIKKKVGLEWQGLQDLKAKS